MSSFTATDLARIQAAIARGVRTVQFADRSVTYPSIDELRKAEARILAELNPGRRRLTFAVSSKGLG